MAFSDNEIYIKTYFLNIRANQSFLVSIKRLQAKTSIGPKSIKLKTESAIKFLRGLKVGKYSFEMDLVLARPYLSALIQLKETL